MILNEAKNIKKKNLHLIIRKIVSNDIANDYVNGLNSNKFVR